MGNPLKDQLLKAGLASRKQAKKVEHEQRLQRKKPPRQEAPDLGRAVREERETQAARTRQLNEERAAAQRQREQQAQIRQLVESSRLAKDDRGEAYHFAEENKIKRIFLAEEMIDQISRGQLGIVKLGESYEVVPAKVAHQVAQRDPHALLVLH